MASIADEVVRFG